MKMRFLCALLAFVMLFSLAACDRGRTGIINPITDLNDASDFESLGFTIDAPADASMVSYSKIAIEKSNDIAQVKFILEGINYTYRGSESKEDISGVYLSEGSTSEDFTVESGGQSVGVKLSEDSSGGFLAKWNLGKITYSLWSAEAANKAAFIAIATELIGISGLAPDAK